MGRKKKEKESVDFCSQSFTLNNGINDIKFKDIYDFTKKTKISSTVALDMLKNKCLTFKNWTFKTKNKT